jgi:hypothetical protein
MTATLNRNSTEGRIRYHHQQEAGAGPQGGHVLVISKDRTKSIPRSDPRKMRCRCDFARRDDHLYKPNGGLQKYWLTTMETASIDAMISEGEKS